MVNLDVQAALEALRQEIQNDRIAQQNIIAQGFEDIRADIAEHGDIHRTLEARMTAVETRQHFLGYGLWGIFISLCGSVVGYFFKR